MTHTDPQLLTEYANTLAPDTWALARITNLSIKAFNISSECEGGLQGALAEVTDTDGELINTEGFAVHCCEQRYTKTNKSFQKDSSVIALIIAPSTSALNTALAHLQAGPLDIGEAGNRVLVQAIPNQAITSFKIHEEDQQEETEEEPVLATADTRTAAQIYRDRKQAYSTPQPPAVTRQPPTSPSAKMQTSPLAPPPALPHTQTTTLLEMVRAQEAQLERLAQH